MNCVAYFTISHNLSIFMLLSTDFFVITYRQKFEVDYLMDFLTRHVWVGGEISILDTKWIIDGEVFLLRVWV
jgi:hypothetical protein